MKGIQDGDKQIGDADKQDVMVGYRTP